MNIPEQIQAGTIAEWVESFSDYPASAGWSLLFILLNTSQKITFQSLADGDNHKLSLPAAVTKNYNPGEYQFIARLIKGDETIQIGKGIITIEPDYSSLNNFNYKTHAQKTLEAIEAAIERRATKEQADWAINGRSVRYLSPEELLKFRDYYRAEVAREKKAERINQGKKPGGRFLFQF